MDGVATEIRTFYSAREIRETVEAEINQYKTLLDDYSQWLGTLLRSPEASKNPDWVKKTSDLQKILRSGNRKGERKEKPTSTEWVRFRDLMLCADDFGEVEIIFEAVEELKSKLDKLEKVKTSLVELERYGLGKNMAYITFIHDGVPEKIAIKPKKELEEEKFKFIADFSVIKQL
ncbi:MAG: hypothetical protein QXU46_00585 [Candidatus Bathyarchaeia archaeon]